MLIDVYVDPECLQGGQDLSSQAAEAQPADPAGVASFVRLPSEDEPVRAVVGWDAANTEAVEFAAWLGHSLPMSVQVMSTTSAPWTKPIRNSGKNRKKRLKAANEAFHTRVVRALKEHLPRTQWADQPAKLVDAKDAVGALHTTANEFDADLILLGSRAKAPKGRFRPTTVADELMRSSPVPLGLAPRGVKLSKKGPTRVTYAIVESEFTDPADPTFPGLDFATALACHIGVPLRIIAFSPTAYTEQPTGWNEATLGMLDRARDRAWLVAEALTPDRLDHFDVQSSVAAAKSWKRAIDSVKWKKGDLMCLGSQPTGQLRSVFVGSRECEFIRFASVPVVICPRRDDHEG